MKRLLVSVLLLLSVYTGYAGHIAGGEVYYRILNINAGNQTATYEITLRLFRECNPPAGGQPIAAMPTEVWIGIFKNGIPSQYLLHDTVTRSSFNVLQMQSVNPCITNAPQVCYQVGDFTTTVTLPFSNEGYVASFQTCCRTNGIANLNGNSQGATYTGDIPGVTTIAQMNNNSAVFALKDTTLICKNSPFTLDFSATDPDGDSLVYTFCDAYNGGPTTNSSNVIPSLPPYGSINYAGGFSGTSPLGSTVTINSQTGIISGISPGPGSYVLNVCVSEYRAGKLITVHRKDFTLKIGDCELTGAKLKPTYVSCDDFSVQFANESTSSSISSYLWDFGVQGTNTDVSTQPTPSYNYPDTGTYQVKLKVQNQAGCQDSATTNVLVYPGFNPDFSVTGSCVLNPYQFNDQTQVAYGVVNKWSWDFGDASTTADVSSSQHPQYKYPSTGTVTVSLIVESSKGCIDTIMKPLVVPDKPSIHLPFNDTLICSIDTLALQVNTTGVVSWTPLVNMLNPTSNTPLVFPKDTMTYKVVVNENGCVNEDSVTVNVLDFIEVELGPDTGICRTDSLVLNPVSHALSYIWTPTATLNNPGIKHPVAHPLVTTKYYVTANLGKCQAADSITVNVTPYPSAQVGNDTTICYGSSAQLSASIVGSSFHWTPAAYLINAQTLHPTAFPPVSMRYVLSVFDTVGCPKPFHDTVFVQVQPRIFADAGRDTNIVANQPLQLQASGGNWYAWSPSFGLNQDNIANPIALLGTSVDSIRYTVRVGVGDCEASDDVVVRVFKTKPEIFVPSAFTPNSDGLNDGVKPVLVGIRNLVQFNIYNRWGQLLFSSADPEKSWDGTFKGVKQPSGTYVYTAEGIDFMGNLVYRKGTLVLIR